ncbi:MAG TPA: S1 family peptidase [Solirubrobacteraceae bacterium]|nr:S1 family peptidase [Solirubrobacteraceae bacterium]
MVLLLVAGTFLGSVVSAVAAEAPSFVPNSNPPVSPEEMAVQYSRQEGVPYPDAVRRMLIQERVHGLPEELKAAFGAGYAGVWLDQATGEVRVGLISSADRAAAERALASRGLGVAGAVVLARTSLGDLEAAQYTVARELRPLITQGTAKVAIDEAGNRVVVTLAPKASPTDWAYARKLSQAFSQGYDANGPALPPVNPTPLATSQATAGGPQPARRVVATVDVAPGPPLDIETTRCGSQSCGLPLRAGVRIETPSYLCSAGFVSTWWSGSRTYFFIMDAGHCVHDDPSHKWEAYDQDNGAWHWIGSHWSWRFGTCCGEPSSQNGLITIDAAIIEMSYASFWTNVLAPGPLWMHGWPSGTEWQLTGQARPVQGEFGCRSGASSSYSCGHATALDVVVGIQGGPEIGNEMEVPGACSSPGDSGGPFVDAGTALGILSAQTIGTCTTFYAKVSDISYWFGVYVYV